MIDSKNINERKVNLFLLGFPKSGTTTLYDIFLNHDQIHFSKYKEPYFFDINFNKGLDWYNSLFDFSTNKKYYADFTSSYIQETKYIERIHEYNSDIKIIILLRDPINALQSAYYWKYKNRTESIENISEAIQKKTHYIESVKHIEHIKKLLYFFNKEVIHFMIFEEFIRNQQHEIDRICDFLDIHRIDLPNQIHKNKNIYITNKNLFKIYGKLTKFGNNILPHKLKLKLGEMLRPIFQSSKKPQLDGKDLDYLKKELNPFVSELEKFLDRDLKRIWKNFQ